MLKMRNATVMQLCGVLTSLLILCGCQIFGDHEAALAEKSTQRYVYSISNPKGSQIKYVRPFNDRNGREVGYIFWIVNNNKNTGIVFTGNSLYDYEVLYSTQGTTDEAMQKETQFLQNILASPEQFSESKAATNAELYIGDHGSFPEWDLSAVKFVRMFSDRSGKVIGYIFHVTAEDKILGTVFVGNKLYDWDVLKISVQTSDEGVESELKSLLDTLQSSEEYQREKMENAMPENNTGN